MTQFLKKTERLFQKISEYSMRHIPFLLICITFLSLALKLVSYKLDPSISRDAGLYLHMAKVWYESGQYAGLIREFPDATWIPPFLIFLIKSLMQLGLPAETAGLAINIGLGTLIPLIGYGIVWESTGNRKCGIITAFLLAINPGINDLSVEIQRDIPYLFFSGCLVWLALAGLRRKKYSFWCGAGIFFSLSLLTRYEALEFLPMMIISLFVFSMMHCVSWKQSILFGITLVFCIIASFFSLSFWMGTDSSIFLDRVMGKAEGIVRSTIPSEPMVKK